MVTNYIANKYNNKGEQKNNCKLKQTTLYAKRHYETGDVWEDVKACLRADDYTPETKDDVIHILFNNIGYLFNTGINVDGVGYSDFAHEGIKMVDAINPRKTWEYGYLHTLSPFKEPSKNEYDYYTAVLHYLLHKLRFAEIKDLGDLPKPDAKVLPLKKH